MKTEARYLGSTLQGNIATVSNRIDFSGTNDADVLFSTVHVAKGLEWANVQVLGDFGTKQFSTRIVDREPNPTWQEHLPWNNPGFEWKVGSQENEANLLYVAVTRAIKRLYIPTKTNLDGLHVGALVRIMSTISEVGSLQEMYGGDLPDSEIRNYATQLAAEIMHVPQKSTTPYYYALLKQAECIRHHMLHGGNNTMTGVKISLPHVSDSQ